MTPPAVGAPGSQRAAVVVHADDLGFSRAANAGIRDAANRGTLTSASLMADGPAFEEAVCEVLPECPQLGIGAHLEIGEPLEGRRPRSPAGEFIYLLRRQRDRELRGRLERSLRSQIERVLAGASSVDHLNSHWHIHAVPALYDLVCGLAREYGIPWVRLPREHPYAAGTAGAHVRAWYGLNVAKVGVLNRVSRTNAAAAARHGVATNDRLVGVAYTGYMTVDRVLKGVEAAAEPGRVVEVLLHPARVVADPDERYANADARAYQLDPARGVELAALLDDRLRAGLDRLDAELTCYRCLSTRGDMPPPHDHRESGSSPETPPRPASRPPLRTFVVMDEEPFYHPEYLHRLIKECQDLEVCGAALVHARGGTAIERYMRKRIRDLRPREVLRLGRRRLLLQAAGRLPRAIRGDHEGSVAAVLARHGIPHRFITRLDPEIIEHVRSFEPDLILSSNSLIFKPDLLAVPRVAAINRHSALLPAYGGVLPVFRAVQKGEAFTGASVHLMVPEIDKGPVLSRKWVPIFEGDTLEMLYQACFRVSYDATVEAVAKLRHGEEGHLSDDGLAPSYYSFPDDDDWREFRARRGRFA